MKPLSHLDWLEAESVYILREVAAECRNPVLLYSIGKDSSVLLHLAAKAFYPGRIPFPVLHIDTTWKFRDMIAFRDRRAAELGLRLIVHTNRDGLVQGIDPFRSGSRLYTDVMKTQALRQALDLYGFDAAMAARGATKRSRAPRSAYFHCARRSTGGIRGGSGPSPGGSTIRGSRPARACACFHSPTGPSSTSGRTSSARKSRSCRFISPPIGRSCAATALC
jgi:hypothetical protein